MTDTDRERTIAAMKQLMEEVRTSARALSQTLIQETIADLLTPLDIAWEACLASLRAEVGPLGEAHYCCLEAIPAFDTLSKALQTVDTSECSINMWMSWPWNIGLDWRNSRIFFESSIIIQGQNHPPDCTIVLKLLDGVEPRSDGKEQWNFPWLRYVSGIFERFQKLGHTCPYHQIGQIQLLTLLLIGRKTGW